MILGVETSCDETAAAVVTNDGHVLASVVSSQAQLHARYGGVVPEVASRRHLDLVAPVVREALESAGASLDRVERVAVTQGPGLVGALLVGVAAAKAIAWARRLPLVPVDHLEGHIASLYLEPEPLEPPFLCLLASGGHTLLLDVKEHGGFGRLGSWFWGFRQQDVVPDIVAVAKSIGGGFPLGAVVTRREIADRYRTQGYFVSSTGGSPLSSVVGSTILNIIEDEGLQENARVVGAHLTARLEALGERHPLVGTVHGSGLYLGLEFVRDRDTLEPATEETAAICDRLLELGVIMQPTGDHQNVLKIKPPLCVSRESADYFADMLDRVLSTGF